MSRRTHPRRQSAPISMHRRRHPRSAHPPHRAGRGSALDQARLAGQDSASREADISIAWSSGTRARSRSATWWRMWRILICATLSSKALSRSPSTSPGERAGLLGHRPRPLRRRARRCAGMARQRSVIDAVRRQDGDRRRAADAAARRRRSLVAAPDAERSERTEDHRPAAVRRPQRWPRGVAVERW